MDKRILYFILLTSHLTLGFSQDKPAGSIPQEWIEEGPRGIKILKRDTNGTGQIDYERHTSARGLKIYEAIDFDHDGRMDTFYYFNSQGILERQEIDTTGNGKIDIKVIIRDGTFIESIWKDPLIHPKKNTKKPQPKSQTVS